MEAPQAGLGGAGGGFFLSLTLGVGQARAVLSLKPCLQVGAEPSATFPALHRKAESGCAGLAMARET